MIFYFICSRRYFKLSREVSRSLAIRILDALPREKKSGSNLSGNNRKMLAEISVKVQEQYNLQPFVYLPSELYDDPWDNVLTNVDAQKGDNTDPTRNNLSLEDLTTID